MFRFQVHQEVELEGVKYRVAEHPAAPGRAFGQEGRAAIVYKLVPQGSNAGCKALKVFKPNYRVPSMVALARGLAPFATTRGLSVCARTVLTHSHDVVKLNDDLLYSVLMPWIEGPTWFELVQTRQELPPQHSLDMARALADMLVIMEQEGIAHCDLSGPNLLLPYLAVQQTDRVALVDVEQLYGPGLKQPDVRPAGSEGYAHREAAAGLWAADADRYAGAVLIAEILGWCDASVRQAAYGESYFDPAEAQQDCKRIELLSRVLRDRWGDKVSRLLERAWRSPTLTASPTFGEWLLALPEQVPATGAVPSAPGAVDVSGLNAVDAYRKALEHAPPGSPIAAQLEAALAEMNRSQSQAQAAPAAPRKNIAHLDVPVDQLDPPLKPKNGSKVMTTVGVLLIVLGIAGGAGAYWYGARGSLSITSGSLKGAHVTLDGKPIGDTPLDLPELAPGPHDLTVSLEGYSADERKIQIARGSNPAVVATLSAKTTGIQIKVDPPDANVGIDDKWSSANSLSAVQPVDPGTHTLAFKKPGYLDDTQTVTLQLGEIRDVQETLKPNLNGDLKVTSDPPNVVTATLYKDGQVAGNQKGVPFDTQLPVGKYKLVIEKPLYGTVTQEFEIKGGETTTLPVSLQATQGLLVITSEPVGATVMVDGQKKKAPCEFTVPAKKLEVRIQKDGYTPATKTVEVPPGRPLRLMMSLAAVPAPTPVYYSRPAQPYRPPAQAPTKGGWKTD